MLFFFLPSLDENKLVLLLKLLIFNYWWAIKLLPFFLGFMFLFIWEQKSWRNCSAKRCSCKTEEYMYLRTDEYMHSALWSSILCCVGWPLCGGPGHPWPLLGTSPNDPWSAQTINKKNLAPSSCVFGKSENAVQFSFIYRAAIHNHSRLKVLEFAPKLERKRQQRDTCVKIFLLLILEQWIS